MIGIGVSLAMDAAAVSITNGFVISELKLRHVLRTSIFFGLFQAFMPVIGWAAGLSFARYIQAFDHWIVFLLLLFVGGKMIFESRVVREDNKKTKSCLHFPTLIILSLATSIDALAVGLSFAFLQVAIVLPVVIIGTITLLLCIAGFYLGNSIGHLFEDKLELFGGLMLIVIGLKILVEHLVKGC